MEHKNFGLTEVSFKKLVTDLKKNDTYFFEQVFLKQFKETMNYLCREYKSNHEDAYDATMDALIDFRTRFVDGKLQYGNLRFLFTKIASQMLFRNQKKSNANIDGVAYRSIDDFEPGNEPSSSQRLTYTSQVLIARKFSSGFSLQITPSYIHRNSVKINADPHDIFAVGIGGRVKLTKRISVNGEYHYTVNPLESIDAKNSLAFGVDIETGGHVFQIILSNSITMIEKSFISESTDEFFEGDVHLGFNISRAFQFGKHKKKQLKEMQDTDQ